jgi:hypothetical protein
VMTVALGLHADYARRIAHFCAEVPPVHPQTYCAEIQDPLFIHAGINLLNKSNLTTVKRKECGFRHSARPFACANSVVRTAYCTPYRVRRTGKAGTLYHGGLLSVSNTSHLVQVTYLPLGTAYLAEDQRQSSFTRFRHVTTFTSFNCQHQTRSVPALP